MTIPVVLIVLALIAIYGGIKGYSITGLIFGQKVPRTAPGSISSGSSDTAGTAGGNSTSNPTVQGNVKFSGDLTGVNQAFLNKVSKAVSAIGGTQVKVTSGYRSATTNQKVGGADNSNHLYGHAIDGEVYVPGTGWVPLGQALLGVASKFGLRSGATFSWHGAPDIVHIDDAYNQK